jgi:uncharacterized damage-inducible protein DinB
MSTTRKFLERVPDERWDWKPDPRSMALGGLVTHIAQMQAWGEDTMKLPNYDIAGYKPPKFDNKAAVLAAFDTGVTRFKASMAAASDQEWMTPWSLTSGSHVIFEMPRAAAVRTLIFNHTIHHRGQLSVYFRLLGVSVPGAYGPSADEQ